MHLFYVTALAAGLFSLSSCQAVFTGIYGIHDPVPLDNALITKTAADYGIPPIAYSTVLDTSFRQVLSRMHRQNPETAKNHSQFLQAVYYDAAGQQQAFYINCYAGGFPNLTWNREGGLNSFPPAQQAPRDTALTLTENLRYLRPLSSSPISTQPANYTVVVHWSRFMTRQSRRLLAAVQQNVTLAPAGTKVEVIYVNTDAFFHYLYQREDQQLAAVK